MCNGNCNQGRDCDCGRPSHVAAAVLIPALIVTACTAIDLHNEPPADWPKLTVGVHKLGFWEMQSYCGTSGLMFLVTQSMACAVINFNDMTCTIYYAADDETGAMAIEHEEMHCKGHDHIGSSHLRDAWSEWKLNNRSAGK